MDILKEKFLHFLLYDTIPLFAGNYTWRYLNLMNIPDPQTSFQNQFKETVVRVAPLVALTAASLIILVQMLFGLTLDGKMAMLTFMISYCSCLGWTYLNLAGEKQYPGQYKTTKEVSWISVYSGLGSSLAILVSVLLYGWFNGGWHKDFYLHLSLLVFKAFAEGYVWYSTAYINSHMNFGIGKDSLLVASTTAITNQMFALLANGVFKLF